MLTAVISRANQILRDAQQRLPVESAVVIEKVCVSIENLNDFINQEMDRIKANAKLDAGARSNARREVLEKAGRKLEVLKDKSNYSTLTEASDQAASQPNERDENSILQYMREREIRDRLFGMTEAQILSHFGASLFEGGNQLLLNAILNAPPGFEMLSEHNLRKLRNIRMQKLPSRPTAKPEVVRTVDASIIEIFKLGKSELDRLRKKELSGTFTAKQPGGVSA
jgi:hypothetical protein